ncbi:MAG: hypothetical protein V3W41_04970 [Planctomycetota bacterium]
MLVVDATDDDLILLKMVDSSQPPETNTLQKSEFVKAYDGGDDVACLEVSEQCSALQSDGLTR